MDYVCNFLICCPDLHFHAQTRWYHSPMQHLSLPESFALQRRIQDLAELGVCLHLCWAQTAYWVPCGSWAHSSMIVTCVLVHYSPEQWMVSHPTCTLSPAHAGLVPGRIKINTASEGRAKCGISGINQKKTMIIWGLRCWDTQILYLLGSCVLCVLGASALSGQFFLKMHITHSWRALARACPLVNQ